MIRGIDKLIFRAVLAPILIALLVLTFVVFAHDLGRLSELLITRNASLGSVLLISASLLPGILIFSLPLAFLIGVLVGLSGLSGESQIVALRACGVPLRRLMIPVLGVAAVAAGLTGLMSMYALPRATALLQNLKESINLRAVTSHVQPRVFNEEFPNIVFYLDDLSVDRQTWSRVFVADNADPKRPRTILAQGGTWVTDQHAYRLQLHLTQGMIYQVDPIDPSRDNISVFAVTDIPVDLNTRSGAVSGSEAREEAKKPTEMGTLELWRGTPAATPAQRLEERVQLQRRLAVPFSVFAFALVALTMGTSMQKGGRTSGLVVSLILVLLFFVLFMNGLRLASVGSLSPWLGAWGANLILGALGALMFARAERGCWITHQISEWHWKTRLERIGLVLRFGYVRENIRRLNDLVISSTTRIARVRFPRIVDGYVSRGFLIYFVWSMITCGLLFIVLTLFDLLDDIIRNRIAAFYVVEYLVFLTPQVLMIVVPISVLLAILIHFGILEKNSEVTALKAGGWSLYRIAVPVMLISVVLCTGLYFLQDRILPHANARQDSLRNFIKGRPAQTSLRPQRKWIFGEQGRVFNYEYFDSSRSLFVGLNVFQLDLKGLRILRRLRAARATIRQDGNWELEDGWIRDFQDQTNGFRLFAKETIPFPEKAAYFQKEMLEPKESSKLTYTELRDYIRYLEKSGYNATELQVELYKKISFPLSCLVMSLLGLPFSFAMGRRGAFHGIAISIVIAITYWATFSVFEQLGAYGMLVPILAAWAPNILFSSAGLLLLLGVRT
ncbi:MAG: YjgP/YjgQ family permease [Acidobacteria bacterium]|nr:YjgP/YjgQ family permease [Acidobacteriota bacterium]